MVASDDLGNRQRTDAIDHGVRIGAVADQVAEHQDAVVVARGVQRRLERLEVPVNIADNEVGHVPFTVVECSKRASRT